MYFYHSPLSLRAPPTCARKYVWPARLASAYELCRKMFVWYFTSVVGIIVITLVFWCCKCYSSPSVRQRAESSRYEQHDSKASTKNVVAIDCEMVRCVPDENWLENTLKRNKKRVAVAVRCAIVDYDLHVILMMNSFVLSERLARLPPFPPPRTGKGRYAIL